MSETADQALIEQYMGIERMRQHYARKAEDEEAVLEDLYDKMDDTTKSELQKALIDAFP